MAYLPLANILHYKLRSLLSSFGIGVSVCMIVVLSGLSRGSLNEVADRWESVNADLIAYPKGAGNNVPTLASGLLHDGARTELTQHTDLVQSSVPVFLWRVRIGGKDNMTAGIDPDDWAAFTNGKRPVEGHVPDEHGKFTAWLEQTLLTGGEEGDEASTRPPLEITEQMIAQHGGMEIMIDQRLADALGLKLNQTIEMEGHTWTIVGIAPSGVMTRVFMPRRTAQFFFGSQRLEYSTMQFVKLRDGVDVHQAIGRLENDQADLMPVRQYRGQLEQTYGMMFTYVTVVNTLGLVISSLFIMVTLYMMVLQRTREIAILKSCGASRAFIVRQVLAESLLLSVLGIAMGLGLSLPVAKAIGVLAPLLTVVITWQWVATAVAAALAGAIFSALYPAWRATRIDMVTALSLE